TRFSRDWSSDVCSSDLADTLAMMLELGGHQVRIVHDGAAAVREAKAFQPDVAFLDIGMPDMSGYQLAGVLRSTPGLHDTVLVARSEERRVGKECRRQWS